MRLAALVVTLVPLLALAQDEPTLTANAGPDRQTYIGKSISFDTSDSTIPEGTTIQEIVWDFGDGTRTTGDNVTHAFAKAGSYTVRLTIQTDQTTVEDTADIQAFKDIMVLIADSTVPENQLTLYAQQAGKEGMLLLTLRSRAGGPEAVTEEELTNQLLDIRDALETNPLIVTWTSGGVGANVLSKFAQHVRQASDAAQPEVSFAKLGVIMLSDTRFGLLAPVAQSAFDQLRPAYILLTKPEALSLLLTPLSSEEAKTIIFNSPSPHRLLGAFSSRTVRDIGPTNFVSFGINFLVNRGVPINNITLILMLPIIATILAFSRQVIGLKAFGLITPAVTALAFLVMGLSYGLIVFAVILGAGTFTRLILRRFHLLYLPRMALVLTNVSISILILLGLGVVAERTVVLSFSIFPILILTLLAEEFIAVQFTSGARRAATITTWTLLLAIGCYYIVSWELFRTIVISYPEVVLLCIPLNILLGRWTGLRLTEYIRFRNLLRYSQ